MDMKTRNQYLHTLITKNKGYHLKSKKEKSALLEEYCRVTGQHRTAVSAKIKSGAYVKTMRHETGKVITKNDRLKKLTPRSSTFLIAEPTRIHQDMWDKGFNSVGFLDDKRLLN